MKLSPPAEDDFVFVNVSRPDEFKAASTQRTIRRHVMRDIGRSRRRTRPGQRTWSVTLRAPSDPVTEHIPVSIDPCNTTFYPGPMSDRALQLMHFSMSLQIPAPPRAYLSNPRSDYGPRLRVSSLSDGMVLHGIN